MIIEAKTPSELISGKEAKLAWDNGEELEFYSEELDKWFGLNDEPFMSDVFDIRKVRLKPRTIMIGDVEVPAPFEPKDGDYFYVICPTSFTGYTEVFAENQKNLECFAMFGAWRTEEEIKQVVAALRKLFKGERNEKNAD